MMLTKLKMLTKGDLTKDITIIENENATYLSFKRPKYIEKDSNIVALLVNGIIYDRKSFSYKESQLIIKGYQLPMSIINDSNSDINIGIFYIPNNNDENEIKTISQINLGTNNIKNYYVSENLDNSIYDNFINGTPVTDTSKLNSKLKDLISKNSSVIEIKVDGYIDLGLNNSKYYNLDFEYLSVVINGVWYTSKDFVTNNSGNTLYIYLPSYYVLKGDEVNLYISILNL